MTSNVNKRSTREIPPLIINADGDVMINIHHPRTVQGGKAIDLSDIRPDAPELDAAKMINHRRCVLFIGNRCLNANQVKAFNKLWAPLEVRSVLYGAALQGLRCNVIVVLDEARTGRDRDWLHQIARLRLAPDGLWVEA